MRHNEKKKRDEEKERNAFMNGEKCCEMKAMYFIVIGSIAMVKASLELFVSFEFM